MSHGLALRAVFHLARPALAACLVLAAADLPAQPIASPATPTDDLWPRRLQVPTRAPTPAERPPVISSLSLHPEGKWLASAGDDEVVRVWDRAEGTIAHRLRGHRDWVRCVAFSPDGALLVSAGNDHRVLLWDPASGAPRGELPAPRHVVAALAFSHDGRHLAVVGFAPELRLYDMLSRKVVRVLSCPDADMRAVAFSPDDQFLAAGGRGGVIRVWRLPDGQHQGDQLAHRRRVRGLAFSPDGARVISVSEDRSARLATRDGAAVETLLVEGAKAVSLLPLQGGEIAVGCTDNTIRLFDLATHKQTAKLEGHTGSVTALTALNGVLISGGYDATLREWLLEDVEREGAAPTEATTREATDGATSTRKTPTSKAATSRAPTDWIPAPPRDPSAAGPVESRSALPGEPRFLVPAAPTFAPSDDSPAAPTFVPPPEDAPFAPVPTNLDDASDAPLAPAAGGEFQPAPPLPLEAPAP